MFFNFKKAMLKMVVVALVALAGFGSLCSTFAGYISDGVFVGSNTSAYTSNSQYNGAVSLFKTLKGKNSDKFFATKYSEPMSKILDDYLSKNQRGMDNNKKNLFTILSALFKDHYEEYGKNKSTSSSTRVETPKTNTNKTTPTSTRVVDTTPKYTLKDTPSSNSNVSYDNNYSNSNNALNEDFDDFFGDGGTVTPTPSHNNDSFGSNSSKGYSLDDLWRDTGSNPKTKAVLKKEMEKRVVFGDVSSLTRDDFSRQIRVSQEVNKVINFSDSDDVKIQKIFQYIKNKATYKANPGYERGSPEDIAWQNANKHIFNPGYVLDHWEGVCNSLNRLFADMVVMAGVDATVQEVEGTEDTYNIGHYYILINGRVVDVTGNGSNPYSSQWTTIKPGGRGYSLGTNLNYK